MEAKEAMQPTQKAPGGERVNQTALWGSRIPQRAIVFPGQAGKGFTRNPALHLTGQALLDSKVHAACNRPGRSALSLETRKRATAKRIQTMFVTFAWK